MSSGHSGGIIPGHEFVAPEVAVTGGEACECVFEPSLRIDAIELARLDEAGDHRPVIAAQ
jgi:hypothetical protein